MNLPSDYRFRLAGTALFAVAFGYVEASVVVYLRALYYPEGFHLPLKMLGSQHLDVELGREAATIVMLAAFAAIAGSSRWQRLGYFMVGFGVWDIGFYCWLRVILQWPRSLTDWDILFLLPLPWIGPVIAPVLVSVALIIAGGVIVHRTGRGVPFRPGALSCLSGALGSLLLMYSFMHDTAATLEGRLPQPYQYGDLCASLIFYAAGLYFALRRNPPPVS